MQEDRVNKCISQGWGSSGRCSVSQSLTHSVHALPSTEALNEPFFLIWVLPWAANLNPPLHTMVMTCFVLSISDETPIIAVMVALSSLLVIVFIIIVLYMLRWVCELMLLHSFGLYFSNPGSQVHTVQKTIGLKTVNRGEWLMIMLQELKFHLEMV